MTTTGCTTLTTTVWVINRVHNNTADGWANTLVTVTTGFTKVLVAVIRVGNSANSGHAFLTNQTQLARGQADLCVTTITTNELSVCTSRTSNLPAFAYFQLDVVDDCTDRHASERHCVTRFHVSLDRCDNFVTYCETLRGQNIVLNAVFVTNQCDESSSVGIVFDTFHSCRHINLRRLKSMIR